MINKSRAVLVVILFSCLVIFTLACTLLNYLPSGADKSDSNENLSLSPISSGPSPDPLITPAGSMVPPEEIQSGSIPVIWDDDGSPDGIIALLYLLRHPDIQVVGLSISCGEAHTELFAQNLTRMLTRVGYTGIPVSAGRETPLVGDNTFPDEWRGATDVFWEVELPEPVDQVDPRLASLMIVEIVKNSPQPVTIFLTGNHTNLAEALRLDPSIKDNIKLIEVMGGALRVPGNINSDYPSNPNQVAEWNIWVDPVAAEEVFQSGIPIQLMPLDATNHVIWTEEDAADWESSGTPEGILAAEILRWMLRSWFPTGVYAWDVVAAVDMIQPEYCTHSDQFIWVDTAPGIEQGRTLIDENKDPNTDVCELPDESKVKDALKEVFHGP
jgi:purine nucleosidase/pyrimidine-specific ribonucleoside hydrolase